MTNEADNIDVISLMQRLLASGYTHPVKRVRTFGGPFVLISPKGEMIVEDKFKEELENDK